MCVFVLFYRLERADDGSNGVCRRLPTKPDAWFLLGYITIPISCIVYEMVNGLHFYSAFIRSDLQYCLTFTHSYTDGGVNHAR